MIAYAIFQNLDLMYQGFGNASADLYQNAEEVLFLGAFGMPLKRRLT